MRTSTARVARTLGEWLLRLVSAVAALAVLGTLVVLFALPRITGGSALTVLTGSMTPGIPVGSLAFIRPVDPTSLKIGDVATYQRQSGVASYVTHRIVAIDPSTDPDSFTFKGDANRGPDENPVAATAIRGKLWFHVPYLGAVRDALHGRAGLTLLAMITLAGYAVLQVVSELRSRRRRTPQTAKRHTVTCNVTMVLARVRAMDASRVRGAVLRQDAIDAVVLCTADSAELPNLLRDLDDLGARSVMILAEGDVTTLSSGPGHRADAVTLSKADHASA